MKLLEGVKADASLSPCGRYRYALFRDWFPKVGTGHVLWIMLNPSTATADVDDPTIRRCQSFARAWGYDGITVANLFALRSTDPHELLRTPRPIGEANDDVLVTLAEATGIGLVVAAWGSHPATKLLARAGVVTQMITTVGRDVHCLGTTAAGAPRHPLYVKGDQPAEVWRKASAQGNAAAFLESETRVERLEELVQFMTRALSAEMEQQYGAWIQGEGPVG